MGIKTMYKSNVNIAGLNKTMVVLNHQLSEGEDVKTVDKLHHVHIFDRSGSMFMDIDGLIENIKQTMDHMSDDDYVSLVWFSGEDQHATIIRGARKDDSIKQIADTVKSTVGLTCFSVPIEQDLTSIVNDLAIICPNFSVTFFTDGHTMTTQWSRQEEERRIFAALDVVKDKIIAFNTIGYGYNYNQDLLVRMAATSQFGTAIHSSRINDYMDIFNHNYKIASELVSESAKVSTNAENVLYLSLKSTKLIGNTEEGNLNYTFNHLNKSKNQFVLIFDADSSVPNFIEYNDELIDVNNIKGKIPKATLNNILYALAYENYYNGNKEVSIDILAKNLGDKALVDGQLNAFTYDEMADYSKLLKKAVFVNKNRYSAGECSADYLPEDNALCVMDILNILASNNAQYIPVKEYSRIGLKAKDEFNLFEADKGRTNGITPFNSLTFNKEKLNVSIMFTIHGKVKLNPKQAAKVGLDSEVNSHIYRNHSFIKDGTLNIKKASFMIDEDTHIKLVDAVKAGTNYGNDWDTIITEVNDLGEHLLQVTIDFTKIPVTNRLYSKSTIQQVLSIALDSNLLEAKQKVLGYVIKNAKENHGGNISYAGFSKFSEEQIEVLQEHGIGKDLSYKGVSVKVESKEDADYYEARTLSFALKGFSSLPSVDSVFKDVADGKKLTKPKQLILDAYNELKDQLSTFNINIEDVKYDEISLLENNILKMIKSSLIDNRIVLNSIKIAKILTGSWFEGLEKNAKEEEFYSDTDGNTIIVKRNRQKVFF